MKDRWSQLSMSEKSDLMSLYIRNGISSLEEIKKHYNSFADGGNLYPDGGPTKIGYAAPPISSELEGAPITSPAFFTKKLVYGSNEATRARVREKYPVINQVVDSVAKAYDLNPSVINNRVDNEGIIDRIAQLNDEAVEGARDFRHNWQTNDPRGYEFPTNGFRWYGLDDGATLIEQGKVQPINEVWKEEENENEKGRTVHSASGKTWVDNIGLMGATLKYFRSLVEKDFPGKDDKFYDEGALAYWNRGHTGGKKYMQGPRTDSRYKTFSTGGSLGKVTPYGQWQYPHQVTTIPSNNITMKGVDYPVLGIDDLGNATIMQPDNDYIFEGNYVTEYPLDNNVLAAMPAPLPPNPIVPLDWDYMTKRNANGYKDMQDMWNYMISKGVSERNAAALMGNIMQESSFDPNKVQKGGDSAVGYFQMHGDKLKSYNNWLKANKRTHSNYAQVDYILDLLAGNVEDSYMKEYNRINDTINTLKAKKTLAAWEQKQLQEYQQEFNKRYARRVKENRLYPYSQMIEMFNNPDLSIEDVTDIFTNSYERAGKPEYKQRQQYARDIYEKFKTKKKTKSKK